MEWALYTLKEMWTMYLAYNSTTAAEIWLFIRNTLLCTDLAEIVTYSTLDILTNINELNVVIQSCTQCKKKWNYCFNTFLEYTHVWE